MKKFWLILTVIFLTILTVNARGPSNEQVGDAQTLVISDKMNDSPVESLNMMNYAGNIMVMEKEVKLNNTNIITLATQENYSYSTNPLLMSQTWTQQNSLMVCNRRSTSKEAKEGCSTLKLPLNSSNSVVINKNSAAV